jgi:hypothetical protein
VEHERAEVADTRDDIHALPHQVGWVHLGAHGGRSGQVHQLFQGDRGEHQVVRVHLDGDPNVIGLGDAVDLLPKLDRDAPLVVQNVHVDAVPGVHYP